MSAFRDSHGWCAQVHDVGVLAVVKALGGAEALREGRRGITPCPACGDRVRGKSTRDRRGPVGMTRDAMGWCCHRCGVKGDAVTLASYLCGQDGRVNREVKDACLRAGIINQEVKMPRAVPVVTMPVYPPESEVRAVMRELFPVDKAPDLDALRWMMTRGLDATLQAQAGLVMTLARSTKLPDWARVKGQPWDATGHRLIAPLCDVNGAMRSLHARQIEDRGPFMPKGTNPVGFELRGLVLACPKARMMLANGEKIENLVIAEGLPDWLSWFHYYRSRDQKAGVIGIVAGAWTQAFADKIPSGTRIKIDAHDDANGHKYMATVAATLQRRVKAGEITISVRGAD
jgi:hypothetical protein